jgi:hypothetical protein
MTHYCINYQAKTNETPKHDPKLVLQLGDLNGQLPVYT